MTDLNAKEDMTDNRENGSAASGTVSEYREASRAVPDGRKAEEAGSLPKRNGRKKLFANRRDVLIALFTVALIVGIYALIGCPIKFFTGISCPGCGMTRAYLSLFTGHLHRAFRYHPLFWLVPPAIAFYLKKDRLPKPVVTTVFVIGVALFAGVYVMRLLDPTDKVVVFCPQNGLYGRLFLAVKDTLWAIVHRVGGL